MSVTKQDLADIKEELKTDIKDLGSKVDELGNRMSKVEDAIIELTKLAKATEHNTRSIDQLFTMMWLVSNTVKSMDSKMSSQDTIKTCNQ